MVSVVTLGNEVDAYFCRPSVPDEDFHNTVLKIRRHPSAWMIFAHHFEKIKITYMPSDLIV